MQVNEDRKGLWLRDGGECTMAVLKKKEESQLPGLSFLLDCQHASRLLC
jgi:hypothetical protein